MLVRVGVDGLGEAAVHAEVGLFVALQSQRAHHHRTVGRALGDGGQDGAAADLHFARPPGADVPDPHRRVAAGRRVES